MRTYYSSPMYLVEHSPLLWEGLEEYLVRDEWAMRKRGEVKHKERVKHDERSVISMEFNGILIM